MSEYQTVNLEDVDDPEEAALIIVSNRIDDPGGDGETLENFWPV